MLRQERRGSMSLPFKIETKLLPYKSTLAKPDLWIRYVPMDRDDEGEIQKIEVPEDAKLDDEMRARFRALFAFVKEVHYQGHEVLRDPEEICAVLMHQPAIRNEMAQVLWARFHVSETDAPFSERSSTGP